MDIRTIACQRRLQIMPHLGDRMIVKQVDAQRSGTGSRGGAQQDREIAAAQHADLKYRAGKATVLLEFQHVHGADGGTLMQPAGDAADGTTVEIIAFTWRAGHCCVS